MPQMGVWPSPMWLTRGEPHFHACLGSAQAFGSEASLPHAGSAGKHDRTAARHM